MPLDFVVCDRETNDYSWWYSSTEYFTCYDGQKCCGDAWSRYCCDKVIDSGNLI